METLPNTNTNLILRTVVPNVLFLLPVNYDYYMFNYEITLYPLFCSAVFAQRTD